MSMSRQAKRRAKRRLHRLPSLEKFSCLQKSWINLQIQEYITTNLLVNLTHLATLSVILLGDWKIFCMITAWVINSLFFFSSPLVTHTDITSSPLSVNTTLNGVAKFSCTYVGGNFLWKANGQKIFNGMDGFKYNETELSQDLIMSTLTVVISLNKNNTNITCTAIAKGSDSIESEPALLLLQGKHQFCTVKF